jgi:hypothetical protein
MGAIRGVLKDLDPSKDVEKEQIELVEALASLAQTKADTFFLEILKDINESGSDFNKGVPVESLLDKRIETHAYSSSKAEEVVGTYPLNNPG